jgi:hypothetical protein
VAFWCGADHVFPDRRDRFDEVLAQLESVAGWRTARVKPPVLILGSLDGIETGVRQLIRERPLQTVEVAVGGTRLVVPTEAEMLRIEAVLILKRNATRDYLDCVAMADRLGDADTFAALADLDVLYPQSSGESALQQFQIRLVRPLPYDLEGTNVADYRRLDPRWHDWRRVADACAAIAAGVFARP